VLGCDVNWCAQVGILACNTAYEDDALGVGGTGFRAFDGVEEGRDGELRGADGMRDVDVEGGIAATIGGIPRLGASWGMPEVCPVSL